MAIGLIQLFSHGYNLRIIIYNMYLHTLVLWNSELVESLKKKKEKTNNKFSLKGFRNKVLSHVPLERFGIIGIEQKKQKRVNCLSDREGERVVHMCWYVSKVIWCYEPFRIDYECPFVHILRYCLTIMVASLTNLWRRNCACSVCHIQTLEPKYEHT